MAANARRRAARRAVDVLVIGTAPLTAIAAVALAVIAPDGAAQPVTPSIGRFSSETAGNAVPAGWRVVTFRGAKPTRYTLERDQDRTVLRADAEASASGLAFRLDFVAADAPMLRWHWKAERLPSGADTRKHAADDAVARVYVTFHHPPERLSLAQRIIDDGLRALFGETPPHATLMYLWDSSAAVGSMFPNPYTDRVRNIVVESGTARLSQWLPYQRDVVADYRAAFGEDPPSITGVAIMSDADTTRGSALAWYGDITLAPR